NDRHLRFQAQCLEKFFAAHRLHFPVREDKSVCPLLETLEGCLAVRRLVDIGESERLKLLANRQTNRLRVIDDQNRQRQVHRIASSLTSPAAASPQPSRCRMRPRSRAASSN